MNPSNTKLIRIIGLALVALLGTTVAAWRMALPGHEYRFPRDHYAHPEYKVEWWYITGFVETGNLCPSRRSR